MPGSSPNAQIAGARLLAKHLGLNKKSRGSTHLQIRVGPEEVATNNRSRDAAADLRSHCTAQAAPALLGFCGRPVDDRDPTLLPGGSLRLPSALLSDTAPNWLCHGPWPPHRLGSRSKTSSIWHRGAPVCDFDVEKEEKKQMSVFVDFAEGDQLQRNGNWVEVFPHGNTRANCRLSPKCPLPPKNAPS